MSNNLRGAGTISDAEFLTAYNNASLSNAEILAQLNTDWTAIGVKLRSVHLQLHRTGNRTGGSKGSFEAFRASELAYEAKLWQESGVIQPKRPGYEAMTKAEYNAAKGQTPAVAAPAPAPATAPKAAPASTAAVVAPAPTAPVTSAVANSAAFKFQAEIFGTTYEFEGANKDDAYDALFRKLRELNFSKVAITNLNSGSAIGINDIVNGGRYKFNKQLTAATCALCMPAGTVYHDGLVFLGA